MVDTMLRISVMTLLAITTIVSVCGCNTSSGVVFNDSGRGYFRRGQYDLARGEFQRALADEPNNAHYAYNLAAAMKKQGDTAGAERLYRHAINIDPKHQPAYHGLASLMVDEGRVDDAQGLINSWVATQPYLAEPHVEMAWLQSKLGSYDVAEAELQQALKIDPQNALAAAQMGHVYEQTGRINEAVAMYDRSLMINPAREEIHDRYAELRKKNWQAMMAGDTSRTEIPVQDQTMMASGLPMMTTAQIQPTSAQTMNFASYQPGGVLPVGYQSVNTQPVNSQMLHPQTSAGFPASSPYSMATPSAPAMMAPHQLTPGMMSSAQPLMAQFPQSFSTTPLSATPAGAVTPSSFYSATGKSGVFPEPQAPMQANFQLPLTVPPAQQHHVTGSVQVMQAF